MPIPIKLSITGRVYIKYYDNIIAPATGDVLLLLNDDADSLITKTYEDRGFNGYIKAKIYDGKVWQNININEFCFEKENKLLKKQRPIDSFLLCKSIFENNKNLEIFKTYRGRFTLNKYEQAPYVRKAKYEKR